MPLWCIWLPLTTKEGEEEGRPYLFPWYTSGLTPELFLKTEGQRSLDVPLPKIVSFSMLYEVLYILQPPFPHFPVVILHLYFPCLSRLCFLLSCWFTINLSFTDFFCYKNSELFFSSANSSSMSKGWQEWANTFAARHSRHACWFNALLFTCTEKWSVRNAGRNWRNSLSR